MFTSVYVSELGRGPVFAGLPADVRSLTEDSVAAVGRVAPQLGAQAGAFVDEVSSAFLSGLAVACLVVAAVAAAGSLFALRFLPARAAAGSTPAAPEDAEALSELR